MLSLLIAVIVTAIVFDYINGFHDAANAIATVVPTGVLPLRTAVIVAGCFNFVGAELVVCPAAAFSSSASGAGAGGDERGASRAFPPRRMSRPLPVMRT